MPNPELTVVQRRTRGTRPDIAIDAEMVATESSLFVLKLSQLRRPSSFDFPPAASGQRDSDDDPQYALTVHYFGQQIESEELVTLCSYLEEQFTFKLSRYFYSAGAFDALKEEGRTSPPMPTADELAAAELLSDKATRMLAIAIRQASGLLVNDLSRQLPQDARSRVDEIRSSLEARGIIAAETVVICKKTNAQVSRVPSPSTLASFAKEGLKCACGNSISDERVDTALSVSERGQWLLDGSHWFTILLIDGLTKLGVPLERILVDQVTGGDELDCIADISAEITLFELKDKEFNLGNAYSFGAKIGIIEPDHPVIVTTEHVGNDAKEHFARSRRRPRESWEDDSSDQTVTYIEGIGKFTAGLEGLISKIAMNDADEVLVDVLPRATLPKAAVLKWLDTRFISTEGEDSLSSRSTERTQLASSPLRRNVKTGQ